MHIRWRGLELPSLVTCDASTLTRDLRQVHRRAVRARLRRDDRQQPAAHSALQPGRQRVTQIKVHSAQHEFTTIPGVVEDVTDIVLNVKSLVVKNHSDSTKVIRIEKNTAGVDHRRRHPDRRRRSRSSTRTTCIATLTDDVPFVMEMVVENGRGYVPATEHSPNSAGDRHHPDRRGVTARSPACATRSKKPASARRRTTTS